MIAIQENISLKPYNTFGIDVNAKYFVEIETLEQLKEIILSKEWQSTRKLILGGGSNLLFTQNFEGLIIKMAIKGISIIEETENDVLLKVAAGEEWHSLVLYAIENNLAGIENLSLIPGLVGAAPMQNIGAYGVELVNVFHELEAIDLITAETKIFDKKSCAFGYRESIFKKEAKGKYVITSVTFKLKKQAQINTSYGAIQDVLQQKGISKPTIKDVSNAVIQIRTSKLPNPKELGNAGSFFKNPEISKQQFQQLLEQYPDIPHYATANENQIKIPAGWLIEQCGFKGKRIGNTGAHAKQALVLVNYGNANGQEILSLAQSIQQTVKEKFSISIEAEVNVV